MIKYEDENRQNFIVKLADHDIGKFLNKGNSVSGFKGTAETAAPEILLFKILKY